MGLIKWFKPLLMPAKQISPDCLSTFTLVMKKPASLTKYFPGSNQAVKFLPTLADNAAIILFTSAPNKAISVPFSLG